MTQKFDYINHYKIDSKEFDYFEERIGPTKDDERRVHEYILSRIGYKKKSILDVGSGSAWVASAYRGSGIKVTSTDISFHNVRTAKEKVPGSSHFQIVADSFALPLKNETYDVIIASEIIEHVIDPERFVNELIKLLKPGGNLIITTPYKEKLRYYLCIHCNKKTPVHAHLHSFDENKLISLYDGRSEFKIFGNKLLIFLRTYIILQYLPFGIWKIIDRLFNRIYNKPAHILVEYYK